MTVNPQDELLDRARRVIRDLREKLSAAEARSQSEPIAVIGMGLRFPGCGSDPEAFWRMIADGRDAVTTVPPDRWDAEAFYAPESATSGKMNTRKASFLDDVRRFDAAFFDITPREAARMDPQQRIFLETAWHALEDAGLPKSRIAGTDTGVFMGVHSHSADYHSMQFADLSTLDAYAATGTAHDMIAGRLAYWLDLHGPAVAVNTACSSSLTAVHLAARSLRAGDCTMAIVGGVNLLLTPASTAGVSQLQLLAGDGRCKTFDARADGMGRGEGCGVVVLKKLDAARHDGDRVLAVIRGSAVNQDGRTNGLTAPNGLAQQRLVRRALKDAGVQPGDIGYIETHGTGTALGDPIEVEALAQVLGPTEQRATPCLLGAVKANVGHLEGAAGIAGLIKAVLVLQHRWFPPVANLETLNPHLALEGTGLEVPHRGREWKASGRRLAGVSSFGWSGTNAHVVLEEALPAEDGAAMTGEWPVVVSARSPEALRVLTAGFADQLEDAHEGAIAGISYSSTLRRTHHPHRIAVKGTNPKEVALRLRSRGSEQTGHKKSMPIGESVKAAKAANGRGQSLDELMAAWEAGAEVDWQVLFPVRCGPVNLPRYPFEGRAYWLESVGSAATAAISDPFPHDWIYSTEWIEARAPGRQAHKDDSKLAWIFLHGGHGADSELVQAARQYGDRVIEVQSATQGDASDLSRELQELIADQMGDEAGMQNVVCSVEDRDPVAMAATLLDVTQTVIRSGRRLKLWFVTQVAEPVEKSDAVSTSQSAVRGFSRAFGLEYPELAGGTIDIDGASAENVKAVRMEIALGLGEDRVALRQGRRLVARLRRDPIESAGERLELKTDGCYVVTGAFGRLGLEIASWLIEQGASHLALVGRRDPSQMGSPELMRQLDLWRGRGITVLAEVCDVSDESQVRELLVRIGTSARSIRGVIHAAGGLHFHPILEASPREVDVVMRAKVEGARILARATRAMPLDFFVLFGSGAATIGLRNGALYAAANSGLDAVAAGRRSAGLPVLCVEWGLWKHPGEDRQSALVEESGFRPMPPAKALRALAALINAGRSSALVADIDWTILGPGLEMRGRHALVTELMAASPSLVKVTDIPEDAAWMQLLRGLPPSDRKHKLLDLVGGEVRTIFGMMPEDPLEEDRGLFQMGMDSLMSVRLKRRFEAGSGLRLPGTLTLTYPTVLALAAYLEEKLFPDVEPASPSLREAHEESIADSIAGMDEAETNAAIAAELAEIQQKLGVL